MAEHENDFPRELIDQQMELPASSLESAESDMVEDLQRTYQSYTRANEESLLRVQGRLNAQLRHSQQNTRSTPIEIMHKNHERKYAMEDRFPPRKTGWSQIGRGLSSIAAVLVVTLLVGGMVLLLNNKKHTQPNTTITGNAPVIWSSGIYMVTLK